MPHCPFPPQLFLFVALLFGCAAPTKELPSDSQQALDTECLRAMQRPLIGPDSALGGIHWQSLEPMGEPRLGTYLDSLDTEAIRFLWSRSSDATIAVRAIRRGGEFAVVSITMKDPDRSCTGTVAQRDSTRLSAQEWNDLVRAVEDLGSVKADSESVIGVDGSTWMIESSLRGAYAVTAVWSSEPKGRGARVRALGLHLLRLGGIHPWPWKIS